MGQKYELCMMMRLQIMMEADLTGYCCRVRVMKSSLTHHESGDVVNSKHEAEEQVQVVAS